MKNKRMKIIIELITHLAERKYLFDCAFREKANRAYIKTQYENGYGASIIAHKSLYDEDQNLFEIAVLYNDEPCYTTDITDYVISNLNIFGVLTILDKI